MTDVGVAAAAGNWLTFLGRYRRLVGGHDDAAAYELFNYFRDAGPVLWFKEPLKAVYHAWLTLNGGQIGELPLRDYYDYCFVVDGTGVPGLSTSLPLLRALPAGSKALLLARDFVIGDRRFADFRQSSSFTVVNIDRTRPAASRLAGVMRDAWNMSRVYPKGFLTIPQLVLRKLKYEGVLIALLERTRVGHLVVSNERLMLSSIAVQVAKRYGVHSACLQHGALVDQYLPVAVDTYLTWGRHASDWFRERAVNARLCPIGAPRIDRVVNYLAGAMVSGDSLSPRATRIVVFFSQPAKLDVPSEYHQRVAKEFLSLLAVPGLELWIKLHPSDRRARWNDLAGSECRGTRLIEPEADPYQVIRDADYVGAFYSTVLLEAMLFDKPVFQLNPYGDAVSDYSRRAGCSHVNDGHALKCWIKQCDSQPAFRQQVLERQGVFAKNYFTNIGAAAAAFFSCLDSIESQNSRT